MPRPLESAAPAADRAELRRFPCAQCGAALEYRPGAEVLRCGHCGHENRIAASAAPIVEQDFRQTLQTLAATAPTDDRIAIHCDSCGASYTLTTAVHAGQCPFCGSPVVAQTSQYRQLQPQALLPFAITRDQARAAFRQWLGRRWFAPSGLKDYARTDAGPEGIYVPYWTYDTETTTDYQGERGDDYQVQENYRAVENGQEVERTRTVTKTRWTLTSGTVSRFFDDVLVLASRSLPQNVTEGLEPWDLTHLTAYQEDYLSGFRSEMYQVALDEGFERARDIMAPVIRRDIERDIGGDHQRIHAANTRYGAIRFKHILLPVWLAAFRFRDRTYRFVVNGRTGKVQGERPYSVWKIIFAIVLAAAVVGGGLAIWRSLSSASTSAPVPKTRLYQGSLLPASPTTVMDPSVLNSRLVQHFNLRYSPVVVAP